MTLRHQARGRVGLASGSRVRQPRSCLGPECTEQGHGPCPPNPSPIPLPCPALPVHPIYPPPPCPAYLARHAHDRGQQLLHLVESCLHVPGVPDGQQPWGRESRQSRRVGLGAHRPCTHGSPMGVDPQTSEMKTKASRGTDRTIACSRLPGRCPRSLGSLFPNSGQGSHVTKDLDTPQGSVQGSRLAPPHSQYPTRPPSC